MVGGRVEFSFVVDRRSHLGEIAPGDTHKPEAISPRPTALKIAPGDTHKPDRRSHLGDRTWGHSQTGSHLAQTNSVGFRAFSA